MSICEAMIRSGRWVASSSSIIWAISDDQVSSTERGVTPSKPSRARPLSGANWRQGVVRTAWQ